MSALFWITLRRAGHVKSYSIRRVEYAGWDVMLEEDQFICRHIRYDDWHRVERAREIVRHEVARLTEQGWRIQASSVAAPACLDDDVGKDR